MKQLWISGSLLLAGILAHAQNVGIGTSSPLARLHVTDSAVLFQGPATVPASTSYLPPVSGSGVRMMWYPQKAAFRVGYVNNSNWDKDNTGAVSFAAGSWNLASGYNSVSFGSGNRSTNYYTTSFGLGSTASGYAAGAWGFSAVAVGDFSTAIGVGTYARSANSVVLGKYNDTSATDRIFEIGDGTADNARNNALTVLANGNAGFGTASPSARLQVADSAVLFQGPATVPASTSSLPPVSGPGVRMMWYPQKAAFRVGYVNNSNWDKDSIGLNSIALGYNAKAKGDRSTSLGTNTTASGGYSTSIGVLTVASGLYATSMGYSTTASGNNSTSLGSNTAASGLSSTSMGGGALATGDYSTSMGYNTLANGVVSLSIGNSTTASGANATSMGYFTKARSDNSLVIGAYNDTSNTNRLFEIGNGTNANARSNALTVLDIGNVGIGTTSPSQKLHVIGNILASGTVTPSDFRYKTDIKKLEDPLGKLAAINGVSYYYKAGSFPEMGFSNSRQVGVIAQEVESVLPEVVVTDANGYKAVDYAKLVPLLIEGMKAQQEHIRQQDEKMAQLLKRIEALEQAKNQ